jgi:hypothetical protein
LTYPTERITIVTKSTNGGATMAKNKGDKMIPYTFRLPTDLLEQLQDKAGLVPVSVVIRKLIEKFIKGEIKLD